MHIVPELSISGGSICLLSGGGFQFHYHQRQSIDKEDHIRALFGIFYDCPLIDHGKIVIGRVFEVNEIDEGRTLLATVKIFHRHTVLQIVHEFHVLLQQRSAVEVFQLVDRLGDGIHGQGRIDPL